ncbi:MAG TPA: hypothetical protein DDY68_02510, partial [Porphyromonadaceae bacterium]|nr:hypothetical protein [Porphyromonadaceae bacterium]
MRAHISRIIKCALLRVSRRQNKICTTMKKKVVSLAMGVISLGLICSCSSDEDKGGSSGLKGKLDETIWLCVKETFYRSDLQRVDTFDVEKGGYASGGWTYNTYKLNEHAYYHTLTFWKNGECYNTSAVSKPTDKDIHYWQVLNENLFQITEVCYEEGKEYNDITRNTILESTDKTMTIKRIEYNDSGENVRMQEWKKVMDNTDLSGKWTCEGKSVTLNSNSSYSSEGMAEYWGNEKVSGTWHFTGKEITLVP